MMEILISGVGLVTIEEFEARLSAYLNAGAPEPVLVGTTETKKSIFDLVSSRGDSQMRAFITQLIARDSVRSPT